jgi:ubiquitin carboxyl-terminal hydrolase 4/11/15
LYDCLSYFGVEESLKGDDMWFCPKCKDHVIAKKKMEVFKAPDYLIIHLKRFSHTRGMFGSRKLNDKIKFPVDDLNMT